jgi:hypothetical protein
MLTAISTHPHSLTIGFVHERKTPNPKAQAREANHNKSKFLYIRYCSSISDLCLCLCGSARMLPAGAACSLQKEQEEGRRPPAASSSTACVKYEIICVTSSVVWPTRLVKVSFRPLIPRTDMTDTHPTLGKRKMNL